MPGCNLEITHLIGGFDETVQAPKRTAPQLVGIVCAFAGSAPYNLQPSLRSLKETLLLQ